MSIYWPEFLYRALFAVGFTLFFAVTGWFLECSWDISSTCVCLGVAFGAFGVHSNDWWLDDNV